MRKNIFITLQYDGTRYSGWQRQGNTDNTIEHKLNTCLRAMAGDGQNIEIYGSGRTDAGVHAMGQAANFHIDTDKTPEEILCYMNTYLPEDIKILSSDYADERFHARLNAIGKTYLYRIDNAAKPDVFMRKYCWSNSEKLDVDSMRELAGVFVGKHDFMSFSDMKSNKKSTVRTVRSIDIFKKNDIINIEFNGDGFLYHMVRKMTAAIVEAGAGRMTVKDITVIMNKKDRQAFKGLAPAKGLALMEVLY